MKKIINTVFDIKSFWLFYICYVSLIFVMGRLHSSVVTNISTGLVCCLFFTRILVRHRKLKKFNYINLEENIFNQDSQKRAEQMGDSISILLYIILFVLSMQEIGSEVLNSMIGVILISSIFYFLLARISIEKDSICLKVGTLLISTIYGLTFVLLCVVIILGCIVSILEGRVINLEEIFTSIIKLEDIMIICYFSEIYLIEFIAIIGGSVLFNIIFITVTPAYQLEKMAKAFKIINIVLVVVGVIIFFIANVLWEDIAYIKRNLEATEFLKIMMSEVNFREYISGFSASNINNMGYILLLPYTLGAIISDIYIVELIDMYRKKSDEAFIWLMKYELIQEKSQEDMHKQKEFKKRYYYYGGNREKIEILNLSTQFIENRFLNINN